MLIKNMERGVYDSNNPFHSSLAEGNSVFKQLQEEAAKEKSISSNLTRDSSLIKLDSLSPKLRKRSSERLSPLKERMREKSAEREVIFFEFLFSFNIERFC